MIIYVFYDEQFYYRERVCITSRIDFVIDISVHELCIFLVLIKFTYNFSEVSISSIILYYYNLSEVVGGFVQKVYGL